MITFYISNDNILRIDGARSEVTKELITSATVTARVVVTSSGTEIAGVTQPIALTAISSQPGSYAGVVPREAALVEGQSLTAQITFTGADGERAYITEEIEVVNRTG